MPKEWIRMKRNRRGEERWITAFYLDLKRKEEKWLLAPFHRYRLFSTLIEQTNHEINKNWFRNVLSIAVRNNIMIIDNNNSNNDTGHSRTEDKWSNMYIRPTNESNYARNDPPRITVQKLISINWQRMSFRIEHPLIERKEIFLIEE